MYSSETIVNTIYGPVQGFRATGLRNTEFYRFHAIPYAKPPLGPLRFKDPQLPDAWTQPFDATQSIPFPYGFDLTFKKMAANVSEDCLRLNVYTKSV